MRPLLLLLAWLATVGVAFYLGSTVGSDGTADLPAGGGRPGEADDDASRVVETPAPPILAPGSRARATPEPASEVAPSSPGALRPRVDVVRAEDLPPFTFEGVSSPDEAMQRLMTYVRALLAGGKDGHLGLLELLDKHIVKNEELQQLLGGDRKAARYIYPWVKMVVNQEDQVLALMETVYETMAEEPTFFAGFDDNTLEIFTEPMAMILPGAVDETRLARFRGWAEAALEQAQTTEIDAVKSQRGELRRALEVWAPPLTPDQALARLRSGELEGWDAVQALRSLPPEQASTIEIGPLLEQAVRRRDGRVLAALDKLPLTSRDIDLLDDAVLESSPRYWAIRTYLQRTGRGGWPAAQAFVERGLSLPQLRNGKFALVMRSLTPPPPADYVRWVLDTYTLADDTVKSLKTAFELE